MIEFMCARLPTRLQTEYTIPGDCPPQKRLLDLAAKSAAGGSRDDDQIILIKHYTHEPNLEPRSRHCILFCSTSVGSNLGEPSRSTPRTVHTVQRCEPFSSSIIVRCLIRIRAPEMWATKGNPMSDGDLFQDNQHLFIEKSISKI